MVSTFLPAEALTETDKTILASDDRYDPIGNASWSTERQTLSARITTERRIFLSNIRIAQDELPPDFDQVSKLLDKESP